MKITRFVLFALLMAATTHPALAADTVAWDSSGDGLLSGTYNFREVMWRNNGDTHRVAIYGSIVFHGDGGYTLNSSVMDSTGGSVQSFSIPNGAYRISASGMGFLDDPIRNRAASPSSTVWGLVSQGIFIGSSTDDRINSLFIAAKAPSTAPTNASFSGSYWAAAVNIPSGNVAQARDMLFPLNPDGQGSLGTVSLTRIRGRRRNGSHPDRERRALRVFERRDLQWRSDTFVRWNAARTPDRGRRQVLSFRRREFLLRRIRQRMGHDRGRAGLRRKRPARCAQGHVLPGGRRPGPAPTTFHGFDTLATYYGAFSAGSGIIVGHQRVLTGFDPSFDYTPYDYTYSDYFTLDPRMEVMMTSWGSTTWWAREVRFGSATATPLGWESTLP